MVVEVSFISSSGVRRTLAVPENDTVMHGAVANGVPELLGDCGGELSCATCHVYVDAAFSDKLGPISPDEDEMLDGTAAPRCATSRLSCQIALTSELDGLIVTTPSEQL
jgi:2Fe-2S ferredoxin